MVKALLTMVMVAAAWFAVTMWTLPEGGDPLTGWRVPAVVAWFFAVFAGNMVLGLRMSR